VPGLGVVEEFVEQVSHVWPVEQMMMGVDDRKFRVEDCFVSSLESFGHRFSPLVIAAVTVAPSARSTSWGRVLAKRIRV
jgi:hypothetical protein